ncbi:Glycosyltransferase, catalytic subunit of cellulose synthase and poly-beta-1,6-N-acetylglucosamine synthase [Paenibacillus sp. 1_12]|uniref:glycosyltransferase family 2 protein n=1 Tax=Paenibacillus sp. 1_12 TaxID=1566278 RepID=UPI0008EB235A|nr:glycosyltransferase [Paenibacillus sp. 1_12]SFL72700.1 Glycosyltransferase, catalytic subunit of cellulose synthase and poly-beta-1,6-N-acetylglucosamine synthase [Paenibacillus sp. 1_12]
MRAFLLEYGFITTYLIAGSSLLYFLIMALSSQRMRTQIKSTMYSRFRELSGSEHVPPVSILVPSYNEELTIIDNVRSLMALEFPQYEVVVINDGSQDSTLQVLVEEFQLTSSRPSAFRNLVKSKSIEEVYDNPQYPKLVVINKKNGGKADALNAGINVAQYPLVATIDADSMLEKDALIRLVQLYMENPEQHIAIGGNVRIANGSTIQGGRVTKHRLSRKALPAMQYVEYMRAFLGGRIGWSALNGLLIVSGAFGLFRKDYLVEVGGYEADCPGEDMNIVMKLHRYMLQQKLPYRILFCPDAVCWTQAPDTLSILRSQRKRWIRGNLWNVIHFRAMLFVPKYKIIGWLALPYTILYETLSPFIKLSGLIALVAYVVLNMTQWPILLAFISINLLISLLFTAGTLIIEEIAFKRSTQTTDIWKIIGYSMLMTVGYDQLNALWKLQGHADYVRRNNSWGTMVRRSWKEDVTEQPQTQLSPGQSTKATVM